MAGMRVGQRLRRREESVQASDSQTFQSQDSFVLVKIIEDSKKVWFMWIILLVIPIRT